MPLKYLTNFRRNLKISLINCEVNPTLTWSANFARASPAAADQVTVFAITL